jgi:hypothetical protein
VLNILFKGNYVSDDQLIKRRDIPNSAVEYGIVTSLQREFGRGLLILIPLFLVMVVATYFKVKDLNYHLTMGPDVAVSFVLIIVLVYLLTFVHEIIHALFYPADAVKEIWKSKEQGAYFVYCEKEISKDRFIVMCLAPMFILGIIPFVIWLILPDLIPMPYNIAVPIIFWLMTIIAMGDVANVYHVIKEVPRGSKVFNYGLLRSFYIKR